MKTKIKKILQIIGFSIQLRPFPKIRKFKNPKVFLKSIQQLSIVEQEKLLFQYCRILRSTKNHYFYNILLKRLVPDWDVNYQSFSFIKGGLGGSSLPTYRKIKINNEKYFEKVYFNSFPDLNRNLWFQKKLYPYYKNQIKVPLIKKTFKGDLITIVYFEFFDLKSWTSEKEIQKNIIKQYYVVKDLNSLAEKEKIYREKEDFRTKPRYEISRKRLQDFFKQFNLQKIEKDIFKQEHRFVHGDLHKDNLFKNSVIIDWDDSGWFPIGLEEAVIYTRLIELQHNISSQPLHWLNENFNINNNKQLLERNFLFFLLVFFLSKPNNPLFQNVIKNTLTELEKKEFLFLDFNHIFNFKNRFEIIDS